MTIKPKQHILIFYIVLLMAAAIVVLNFSMLQEQEEAYLEEELFPHVETLPFESGVFERADFALAYQNMPDDENHLRTLEGYYKRRAFSGAPPVIPHAILDENTFGGKACLQCHQNGGYVEQFKAYAPVTPHPELINCKQCHVPVNTNSLFKATAFEGLKAPAIGNRAMEGSPPVIPHSLQLRENCLACHAGPAAPKAIRVTHPERVNCRSCHALKPLTPIEWERPAND
jgi:nitrate reductase (cytochrome), electron transfer subunit